MPRATSRSGVIALAIPLARHASLALESEPRARQSGTRDAANPATNEGEPPAAVLAVCALALAIVGGTFSDRLKTWEPVPSAHSRSWRIEAFTATCYASSNGARICSGTWAIPSRSISIREASWSTRTSLERDYAIFFYGMDGADRLLQAYPHDFVLIGAQPRVAKWSEGTRAGICCTAMQTAALFARARVARQGARSRQRRGNRR